MITEYWSYWLISCYLFPSGLSTFCPPFWAGGGKFYFS